MSGPGETGSPGPASSPEAPAGQLEGSWRWLGAVLALALAFAAVVMVVNGIDTADSISCSDRAAVREAVAETGQVECYDQSDAAKTATVFLGFASAAFALIGAYFALLVAFTARLNRYLLPTTGVAIGLGVATIVINNL